MVLRFFLPPGPIAESGDALNGTVLFAGGERLRISDAGFAD